MRRLILKVFKFLLTLVLISTELLFAFLVVGIYYILVVSHIPEPEVAEMAMPVRRQVGENHYVIGDNWLKKNDHGIWEMYIEGDDYERGLIYGALSRELVQQQEKVFVAQINDFVPSSSLQRFLQLMLGFFNKELVHNIPEENLREIYGVSQSFSDEYDYIGTKYGRILNYHAAHDIGHALNDYSIVGCTSFAIKGDKTRDGNLLVGRNFDFYVGDDFAKEKILLFVNPKKGYKFASYSWAGFTGVASGMNEKGLSVTINASKSELPRASKTPISIVAREILQYASTIEEAIAIAKKRAVFVSETIMVSSKIDGKAGLIEKSPEKMGVYFSPTNTLICSNHYQSDVFKNAPENKENIADSDTRFRFERTQELLNGYGKLGVLDVAMILRNQNGAHNDTLGIGNPKALNQLIGHHSVIFEPSTVTMWISTNDYQLGDYIAYDLPAIFAAKKTPASPRFIPADPFLFSPAYAGFQHFRKTKSAIFRWLQFGEPFTLSEAGVKTFIASNSESYVTYEMLGKYFLKRGNKRRAKGYFQEALTKNPASENVKKELHSLIRECATN